MNVYLVESTDFKDSYVDSVFKNKEDALKKVAELEKEMPEDSFFIIERELE